MPPSAAPSSAPVVYTYAPTKSCDMPYRSGNVSFTSRAYYSGRSSPYSSRYSSVCCMLRVCGDPNGASCRNDLSSCFGKTPPTTCPTTTQMVFTCTGAPTTFTTTCAGSGTGLIYFFQAAPQAVAVTCAPMTIPSNYTTEWCPGFAGCTLSPTASPPPTRSPMGGGWQSVWPATVTPGMTEGAFAMVWVCFIILAAGLCAACGGSDEGAGRLGGGGGGDTEPTTRNNDAQAVSAAAAYRRAREQQETSDAYDRQQREESEANARRQREYAESYNDWMRRANENAANGNGFWAHA